MQIYSANQKGPLKVSGFIDPDDVTKINVWWGCQTWIANTVYRHGDIAKPTVDNGYYYTVTTNGRSSSTEPKWTQDETTDNTVIYNAVPWDLWLLPDQTLTASSWSCDDPSVILSEEFMNDTSTSVNIMAVSNTAIEFTITNQVTKTFGEKLSRSFKYKVNQQ